jgi:hypothetical protein
MENSNRKIWLIVGGAALVACACLVIVTAVGSGLFLWGVASPATSVVQTIVPSNREFRASPNPEDLDEATSTPADGTGTFSPGQTATQPPTDSGSVDSAELPETITRQMDQIQRQVITLRGLQPSGSVERALLTPEQLREHVTNNLLADYTPEEARDDVIFLSQLGLLAPDFDLEDFYLELYSEQIAGYYDDETKEMYVVRGESFEGPERLTYAHEYTHALQDQNYNFEKGLNFSDEACKRENERCNALQALVEGDASVSELEWFTNYGTQEDLAQIQEFYSTYNSPVFDSAPSFMREDFIFPYTYGQAFVESLRSRGNWRAVDQAFLDPPVSTEQILHPERYPNDRPVPVTIPDLAAVLGEGWREVDRQSLGEWYTYLLLAHGLQERTQIEATTAQSAAQGWGGDAYVVYHNDATGESVLVLDTTWESEAEAREFAAAFEEYAGKRFGEGRPQGDGVMTWETPQAASGFQVSGERTVWVLAPEMAVREALFKAVLQP